jgi:stage IV sporulation protein FB
MKLSFHLGRIPVQIHPMFFILAGFLGMNGDPRMLVPWLLVVFVSVMLHELGHATTGLAFGLEPRIDLHGMGGTTSWATPKKLSIAQRIAISLAGPFAGFIVGAIVFGLVIAGVFPDTPVWASVVGIVLWVNVGWGVFNLLPVLPLDGGNVMLQVLHAFTGGRGERIAHYVSIGVAALGIVAGYLLQLGWWGAMLALMFIGTNYQGLQSLKAREHDAPMRDSLKKAYAALESKDAEQVLALARPVALESKTPQVRAEALQLVAFGFLLEGRVADADAAIAALPKGYAPHPSLLELRAAAARP